MCVVTQYRIEREQSLEEIEKEYMYLIGGFAGWPRDDPRWNGDRTRNDVWLTTDGRNWSRVAPPPGKRTMPFIGRVWHSCTVWHDHKSRNQAFDFGQLAIKVMHQRVHLIRLITHRRYTFQEVDISEPREIMQLLNLKDTLTYGGVEMDLIGHV